MNTLGDKQATKRAYENKCGLIHVPQVTLKHEHDRADMFHHDSDVLRNGLTVQRSGPAARSGRAVLTPLRLGLNTSSLTHQRYNPRLQQ